MASPPNPTKLPPYLFDAWRLQHGAEQQAKKRKDLDGWTVSALAESHMKLQIDNHNATLSNEASDSAPSLSSIAVGRVLDVLASSGDLTTDVKTIADSLSSITLRQLLNDPRTTYQVLRRFLTLPQTLVSGGRRIVDVDEAILSNERYIRSQVRGATQNDRYLVSLENLCAILRPDFGSKSQDEEHGPRRSKRAKKDQQGSVDKLTFTRADPPKGGLQVLDEVRKRNMIIQASDVSFTRTFERITKGILRGLNWSNVLLAGGMALTTLIHIDSSKDDDWRISEPDLDLYIYGLGPEDANRKVEEIHDIWVNNLPATSQKLVVKNAKTINLLASYPNRRIQIVLKLLPSPTDVLLNFDLDACAIGFDGSHAFMLPRCARAIETGYSIFTMDLVWGHHLGNRRATQDTRVFKYAERGFGIRILPSYARSIEEESLESMVFNHADSHKTTSGSSGKEVETEMDDDESEHEPLDWKQRDRKPDGQEPGLKTLKRIAYLGQDFVHRFYFGATPLARPPQIDGEAADDDVLEAWRADFYEAEDDNRLEREENERSRAAGKPLAGPLINLSDLDTTKLHYGLPDGRRGLGNFEIFMRHCEAWRLDARAEATINHAKSASMVYDAEAYDDLPTYEWNKDFNVDCFARTIDVYNDHLWDNVKVAICEKLGIGFRRNRDYSTRRIRRQVCGPDLATVQEKQITIPVLVPSDLENYLFDTLPQQYIDLPSHFTDFIPLIPVHDFSKYDPSSAVLPSLRDTVAESGNLRYWVITNESMWAQQHRVLDEFSEVMWSLFHCFHQAVTSSPNVNGRIGADASTFKWHLARSFRRRIILPEVPDTRNPPGTMKSGLPSLREALLFRPWALISPVSPDREYTNENEHDLFDEHGVKYPFQDELFWKDGDEGEWNGDGASAWIELEPENERVPGERNRPF